MSAITFHVGELDRPDVAALLSEHFRHMQMTSPPEACHVLPIDGLRDPAVTFWSARVDGALAGVGALKALDQEHGEIKSMRVADDFLGKGIGRAVLGTIIDEARRRGLQRLSLETGNSHEFVPALSLYETAGFEPCGPFGDYAPTPFTVFLSRPL